MGIFCGSVTLCCLRHTLGKNATRTMRNKKSLQSNSLYSICRLVVVKNLYMRFEMTLHYLKINNIYTMAILRIAII